MLNKLLLGILVLSLSACIKVRDPDKEAEQGQVSPQMFSQVTYQVEPLPEFQKYQVTFKNLETQALIHRQNMNSKEKSVVVESFIDVVDQPGLIEYRISKAGQEQSLQVEIPLDVLVEGDKSISELPLEEMKNSKLGVSWQAKISGRLFFKKQSRLITNGLDVLILADRVYVDKEGASVYTHIDTKAVDSYIVPGQRGKSGGLLYFKANEMQGWLHFVMNGQDGSVGGEFYTRKKNHHRNMGGFDGGHSGTLIVDIKDSRMAHLTYEANPGKAGLGMEIKHTTWESGSQSNKKSQTHVIVPKGPDGKPGIAQPTCLLVNGQCEEMKKYN